MREEEMSGDTNIDRSSDFGVVADSVFGTLLTITTILSGVYVSITFGWFGQAMIEPHPGEPMKPEMVTQATAGVILGLIFILPLVHILVAWALSKFRHSLTWKVVAWSGLIYCLTQDFIGLLALFEFPLIASGALVGSLLIAAGAFVVLTPLLFGTVLGYRLAVGYSHSMSPVQVGKGRLALTVLLAVVSVLAIQGALGLVLLYPTGLL
jgi:hypothetical protein